MRRTVPRRFPVSDRTPDTSLRVLHVVPDGRGNAMLGARRQVAAIVEHSPIDARVWYLKSRRSISAVLRSYLSLRSLIRSFRPHIVHAQYGTVTALVSALAGSAPLFVTFQGSDLNGHGEQAWPRRAAAILMSQLTALLATRVICVTPQLRRRLWFRRNDAEALTPPIDTELFCPVAREIARRQLGWDQHEQVVLFAAGVSPKAKGIELATAAVELARKRVPTLRLEVIRTTPPELVPLYLNAADCLALASYHEGSPAIVREAMACNLPVISVDVGDVRERLTGVFPSRIVERDPGAFAAGILDVLAAGTRSNGRKAVAEYTETAYAARVVSLYVQAVGSLSGDAAVPTEVERQRVSSI